MSKEFFGLLTFAERTPSLRQRPQVVYPQQKQKKRVENLTEKMKWHHSLRINLKLQNHFFEETSGGSCNHVFSSTMTW